MRKLSLSILAILLLLVGLQLSRRALSPPAHPQEARLVSLAPDLTTLAFALGSGSRVVGVTTYCDDPPEAREREKVGSFLNPNLEKIVALEPSLVLAEHWSSSRTVPRLRQLGLKVFEVPTPQSLAEIRKLITRLGEVLSQEEAAKELLQKMDQQLTQIRNRAAGYSWRPKVYLEIDVPGWTVGSFSFTHEALEISGFENIFGDVSQPAPRVSNEAIIERDPDIIISFAASAKEVAARPGWREIQAVRRGWIIDDFGEAWLSRGNHRLVTGMQLLQERVEQLPNWDPAGPPG